MKYKYILFDADDTLFDFGLAEEKAIKKSLDYFNISYVDNIVDNFREINKELWKKYELGEITKGNLQVTRFKILFETLSVDEDPDNFNNYYLEQLASESVLINGAEEICRVLSKKYVLAIVTNGIKSMQEQRFNKSALKQYISNIFISSDIGYQKPQKEFFEYVFEKLEVNDKNSVLIVGDSLSSDIKGGNNVGIETCWFNRYNFTNDKDVKVTYEIKDLYELRDLL